MPMRPEALENVPEHAKAGLMAMNAGKPIAEHGIQPILDRYEAGESVKAIAESLGVKRQSVYRALVAQPEWQHYQTAAALVDLEDARESFRDDALRDGAVPRVREQAKLAQWTLERTARAIYGDKLTVEHHGAPSLTIVIGSVAEPQQSQRNTPELPPIEHQP